MLGQYSSSRWVHGGEGGDGDIYAVVPDDCIITDVWNESVRFYVSRDSFFVYVYRYTEEESKNGKDRESLSTNMRIR